MKLICVGGPSAGRTVDVYPCFDIVRVIRPQPVYTNAILTNREGVPYDDTPPIDEYRIEQLRVVGSEAITFLVYTRLTTAAAVKELLAYYRTMSTYSTSKDPLQ